MGRRSGWAEMRKRRLASEAHKQELAKAARYREKDPEKYRASQAQRMRETRAIRILYGVCYICGKDDAFPPWKMCPACIEKTQAAQRKYNKKARKKRAA